MTQLGKTALAAGLAYLLGLVTYGAISHSPRSEMLELREVAPPFSPKRICKLHEHDSLKRRLGSAAPDLGTADDENAFVLLDGDKVFALRFTTFRFRLADYGCSIT